MPTQAGKRDQPSDGKSSAPSAKRNSWRKRTALACEECRVRKRRCDGEFPVCGGCEKRMTECIYASEIQSREWHQSMIQSLRTRLGDLERRNAWETALQNHVSHPPTIIDPTPTRPRSTSISSTDSSAHFGTTMTGPPEPDQLTCHVQDSDSVKLHIARTQNTTADEGHKTCPPAEGLPSSLDRAVVAHYSSPSRCIEPHGFERLMRPIDLAMKTNSTLMGAEGAELDTSLLTNSSLASQSLVNDCACKKSLGDMRCSLPSRARADALITVFFRRTFRMTPILHEPTFREQYERLWESRSSLKIRSHVGCAGFCKQKSLGVLFPPIIHAVLAVGALFETSSLEENMPRAEAFFQLIQGLELLEILDNEVSIELVQLSLLMGIYLQSTERFSKCWVISGLAIRMAQNMGLQFSTTEARKRRLFTSSPTQLECEMRKRVWHACVILETEVSLLFGQSQGISVRGTVACLPEAIDDIHLSREVGILHPQPDGIPSLIECFTQRIKLYDIMRQALDRQRCETSSSAQAATSDIQVTLYLDTLVMAWYDELPSYLKYDPANSSASPMTNINSSENLDTQRLLDLIAQAKRLHCRFLYVRQLILRPSLESLFQKQRGAERVERATTAIVSVSDTALSGMAIQCLECTLALVKFLGKNIDSNEFTCWWDNISYFYTCGSTLLMGRNCRLQGDDAFEKSFNTDWKDCLKYLSRYGKFSSIAKNSSCILSESMRRLQKKACPTESNGNQSKHFAIERNPSIEQLFNDPLQNIDLVSDTQIPINGCTEQIPGVVAQSPDHLEYTDCQFDLIDDQFWMADSTDNLSWPFLPFISQLETFSNSGNI